MTSSRPLRILVTGGGTSGHISPALALISQLRAFEPDAQFLYIGSQTGLERTLITAINVPFRSIQTGKLRRYLSFSNLVDQTRIPLGIAQSLWHLKKFKPDVVLATGGYVAVPPVIAASILRIPILIHEQTVQIGLANRINARFASKIALSWPQSLESLSPATRSKAHVTGNPLRDSIFGGNKERAREHFGFVDETIPTLYITGGSLGARVLNRAVEESLSRLLQSARVIHQCGEQANDSDPDLPRLQRARESLPAHLKARYAVTPFVREELRDVFALADLVVSRAGAGTLAELCALGKPALYVPLVPTGGDEQSKNAQMCVEVGAAQVLLQSECRGETLCENVEALLKDGLTLREMGERAKTLARFDAGEEIAKMVVDLARKRIGFS